ncbi:MAG: hypothetical protein NZ581_01705 [Candidatus Caldarchaeum sp.]|nr:hypothetical protein [Candidatus Caldarchaeum sp.]MDW8434903.1 hypothetical protein [Candidatus Caldarchaeum sp.]
MFDEEYRRRYVFGCDYGTSDFKYGPITQGDKPLVTANRGYFPEKSIVSQILGAEKDVVVGKDVTLFLGAGSELSTRLVYPMRSGTVAKDDDRAWRVVEEISREGLAEFKPSGFGFKGFYVVAALSATAPRYMYEKMFTVYEKLAEEGLIHSSTIIPQPLAVAIAHKQTSCVVVESGHGNTQVAPISRAPIREAIIALNRGGSNANAITAEILKDAGYGDLVKEESLVRKVKENIGLLPLQLDKAVNYAKNHPEEVRAVYQPPGTRIKIDLGRDSWTRFLIGEYVFDPNHEIFQSYHKRGMPRPSDTKVGDVFFYGTLSIADTIIQSVEKCPTEIQPLLYGQVILSGGNFSWQAPAKLRNIAVDSQTRLAHELREKGVEQPVVNLSSDPQYAVWRGCIVFGYAVPSTYGWTWDKMEGWYHHRR